EWFTEVGRVGPAIRGETLSTSSRPERPAQSGARDPMVDDLTDPRRVEPSFVLGERAMLEGWLEFHRTTLLLKCEGLDDAGRKARPVPTSKLSLHGLVRHMAEVERNWFHRVLLREPDTPPIWYDPAVDGRELVSCGHQTLTMILPVLPPVKSRLRASGACSRPSTTCSACLTLPSATQPNISSWASGKRSR